MMTMENAKIMLAVIIPLLLIAGGGYYFVTHTSNKGNPQIPVEEILLNERTVVYPELPYQHHLKSEYDGIFCFWEKLWKSHNYYNFTEELVYEGKKYANISVSIYPYDFSGEDGFSFFINVTYHGYMGELVKFRDRYYGDNVNASEWKEYELWVNAFETKPGVVSLDENRSVNYTTYIESGDKSTLMPNSSYIFTGPTWWDLTYNISGDAKNIKISVFEGFSFMWIDPNATIPYAHIPLKFEFWVIDGDKILNFSTYTTFKIPIILGSASGIVLPEPEVNITKMENNSVRLYVEPTYGNYTDIYIFWMDGNYTVTKSKVAWHAYTKSGKYPIMVFYSYRGKVVLPFYSLNRVLYNFTFDGFQLSHIWNDDALVEVNI